jgi:hypothetical protein
MGLPMAGMVTPTMNVGEIDKRIADLKSVENWLNLNLGVLRMTIQGLEMQKAGLEAMQGGLSDSAKAMQNAMKPPAGSESVQDAWWTMLQQAQQAADKARKDGGGDSSGNK